MLPRILIVAGMALTLAACGRDDAPAGGTASAPPLQTIAVEARKAPRERIWDGVVEAVDQATLSAQTGGRVTELPFDVNDYVKAGEVVVRFTDVEQQAGQRRAQAAYNAADAAYKEAEADYRRIAEVYERQLVSRAQFDQATARRDAARAQLEAARAALVIFGQTHFIKTVEDLYEIMVGSVPNAKFGIAFSEASGHCLPWRGE